MQNDNNVIFDWCVIKSDNLQIQKGMLSKSDYKNIPYLIRFKPLLYGEKSSTR